MAKPTTATGFGIFDILDTVKKMEKKVDVVKKKVVDDETFAQNRERMARVSEAESTLKYGGKGKKKKRTYDFLSAFMTEDYAKSRAEKNADPEEMEEAWRTKRNEGRTPDPAKSTGIPSAVGGRDELDAKIDAILDTVTQIATRISSKDLVQVNKSGFAVNAPAGGFARAIPSSKYFGSKKGKKSTASKLAPAAAVVAATALKTQMTSPQEKEDDPRQLSYAEAVQKAKAEKEARETLKYGGTSKMHKFKHGFMSAFATEDYADSRAMKNADPEVMEKAWRTLNPLKAAAASKGSTGTPAVAVAGDAPDFSNKADVDTISQVSSMKAADSAKLAEKAEAEDEDRQVIIDKLDEILKAIGAGGGQQGESGGGGGGILSSLAGGLMGRGLMSGAATAARFALPALAVGGAGYLGYKAGGMLYNAADKVGATRPAQAIMDRVTGIDDPDKSYREGMSASLDKKNAALKGTGYTALSGGYKDPNGKVVYGKDLPPELQQKLGLKLEPPKASATPNKEAAVAETVAENVQLKTEVKDAKTAVNNTIQKTSVIQKSTQPTPPASRVIVRNTEPSVATYTASIFDHPVVHPGIYGM